MTFSSFRYLIKEGIRSIWSNRLMSLASILVLLVCLLLIGASVLVTVNINSILDFIEAQNEMVIFLADNISDVEKDNVRYDLERMESVELVTFVSRQEGLESFSKSYDEDHQDLFTGLIDDNPFPDKYNVTLNDISQMNEVRNTMENTLGVLKVSAPTDLAETLLKIRTGITYASLAIVAMLIVVSFVIIGNTIKLTVFNRRKEINIMKFVGATDAFIRLPFIIESVILGLISTGIAFAITWKSYDLLAQEIVGWASGWLSNAAMYIIPFESMWVNLLLGFIVGGVITCVFSSSVFIKKHLKV